MELIDKSALVAEIEKVIEEPAPPYDSQCRWEDGYYCGLYKAESIIDTLEVKEVDLEKEIEAHIDECLDVKFPTTNIELIKKDVEYTARKFFELGLSTQTSTVWHYVSEEIPTKFGNSIIVASKNKNKEDGIWLYDLIQSWEGEWNPRVNWENPVKWAYMEDLLK